MPIQVSMISSIRKDSINSVVEMGYKRKTLKPKGQEIAFLYLMYLLSWREYLGHLQGLENAVQSQIV